MCMLLNELSSKLASFVVRLISRENCAPQTLDSHKKPLCTNGQMSKPSNGNYLPWFGWLQVRVTEHMLTAWKAKRDDANFIKTIRTFFTATVVLLYSVHAYLSFVVQVSS